MNSPEEPVSLSRAPFLPSGKSLRILYVDHHAALREIARLALTRLGHRLECHADSMIAVQKTGPNADFDLVIADHDLPNLNGTGLIERLRAKQFAGKVIILASQLSALAESEYFRLKVDRIMFKPVQPSDLRACIGELFPGAGRVG